MQIGDRKYYIFILTCSKHRILMVHYRVQECPAFDARLLVTELESEC